MHGVVPEFRGEHYFLSNYCYTPFVWRNVEFPTAEHAFAYAKTFFSTDADAGESIRKKILATAEPGPAKKLGRYARIDVEEWDKRKVWYMREIVHAKFSTGEGNLVGRLINTGAKMLVEGNDWNDSFWGRCKDKDGTMVGFNTLGVILMEERGRWLGVGSLATDRDC